MKGVKLFALILPDFIFSGIKMFIFVLPVTLIKAQNMILLIKICQKCQIINYKYQKAAKEDKK